jgi:hypothetical protein
LHDGGNPNGCKTQVFDVVQLSHQPFKITSPGNILRVFDIVVCALIPRAPFGRTVIRGIPIIETGSDEEIDTFFTNVFLRNELDGQTQRQYEQAGQIPFHRFKSKKNGLSVKVILR